MDVLQYTAFNQQVEYQKQIREKEDCYRTIVTEKVGTSGGGGGFSKALEWICEIEPCLLWKPVNVDSVPGVPKYWDCIPEGSGWTGGTTVCDPTGYYRCGYNCTWCVPSGVTCARFQLWGAGGGSGSARSYADSPFGSTGAYASAIIPVTPGECYCMCSGCAYCCYSTAGGRGRIPGCPSYVRGPGFCYFCAEGGEGTLQSWIAVQGKCSPWKMSTACCSESGGCLCEEGHHMCNSQVCAICQGPICFLPGSMYNGCITCPSKYTPEGLDENSIVYGIRGIWPTMCYDTNRYGWNRHAPIKGWEMCSQCQWTWSSGNCCSFQCSAWQSSCLRIPAAGGFPTHMWGSDGACADAGRMGMVCVQYK